MDSYSEFRFVVAIYLFNLNIIYVDNSLYESENTSFLLYQQDINPFSCKNLIWTKWMECL